MLYTWLGKDFCIFLPSFFFFFFQDMLSIMSFGLHANNNKYIGSKLHYSMSQQEQECCGKA